MVLLNWKCKALTKYNCIHTCACRNPSYVIHYPYFKSTDNWVDLAINSGLILFVLVHIVTGTPLSWFTIYTDSLINTLNVRISQSYGLRDHGESRFFSVRLKGEKLKWLASNQTRKQESICFSWLNPQDLLTITTLQIASLLEISHF
jgi:hypothetical protein